MSTDATSVGSTYEEFRRKYEAEQVLSLRDILQVVKSRLWVMVLVVITCVGLAAGYSVMQTPMYEASTTILMGQDNSQGGASNPQASSLNNDIEGLQNLSETIVAAINTRPIADEVAQRLGVAESTVGNLSAEAAPKSLLIDVSYRDPDPERAQLVSNTAGEVLSERAPEIAPGGDDTITATVWEKATLPNNPVSPDLKRNVFLALILGLILGFGLVFVLSFLDNSWRSAQEIEEVSGTPNLAAIPTFKVHKNVKRKSSRRPLPGTVTPIYRRKRHIA